MADKLTILGPVVCGLVYALTGIAFLYAKRPSWALVYAAYALANIGLIWASIVERS